MKELSLHILDLVQNSITAQASAIIINVFEKHDTDLMIIEINDNGKGMTKEFLQNVTNPFVTSRSNRKVGLGISLFKEAAELCDGSFEINSEIGKGTSIKVQFKLSHIDRAPLGDMEETMILLIAANPLIDFVYKYEVDDRKFIFDTKDVKNQIQGIEINNLAILDWIRDYLRQGIMEVRNEIN